MKTTLVIAKFATSSLGRTGCICLAFSLLLLAPSRSAASSILIDFDSVATTAAGADPTAYLASFGVTLSGVSPSNPLIYSDQAFYGSGAVQAASGHNFLLQQSAVFGGSYTMNFSTALSDVQFTIIESIAPNLVGAWSATAYSGATVVGQVGIPFLNLGAFSPQTYDLSGSDITSLTIYGNGGGAAGISSAMIDNLTLTPSAVPDVANTFGLIALSVAGLAALRRKFAGA